MQPLLNLVESPRACFYFQHTTHENEKQENKQTTTEHRLNSCIQE